jgi:pimeloyl-ACP methyl ester carboxylesterase
MKLFFDNEDFDGQFLRALSYTAYGGADIGECFETASRIKEGERTSWYEAFTKTADRLRQDADESLENARKVSARRSYLRASNYYRAAEFYVRADRNDPRSLQGWQSSHDCFAKAAELFDPPFEAVEIPYEGTTLPGYFFSVDDSGERRPTVITMTGMDGYQEETYFGVVAAALERGYNCLTYDGPGQGGVLRQREVPLRPDWEAVVIPVVDFAMGRPGVDPDRMILIGRSFGGYLAPRGAAFEHRLAAVIADPGQFDEFDMAMARMPQEIREAIEQDDPKVDSFLEKMVQDDARRFFLATRMRAFGAKTLKELVLMQREYSLKGLAEKIECPTLVCDNVGDAVAGGQGKELYEALRCPKDYVLFTAEEGADGHCEGGAQVLFHRVAYDWLDKTLATSQASEQKSRHANF